ncbi:type II toxin-antitoxin system Phd/YefM family antitoxin [Actinophytocola sediminis]
MTDDQASRNFSVMLEAVEQGEEVLVVRDGVPVARLVPERLSVVDRITEVMANHPLPPEAIDEWESAIKELREWQDDGERVWPTD